MKLFITDSDILYVSLRPTPKTTKMIMKCQSCHGLKKILTDLLKTERTTHDKNVQNVV